MFSVIRTMRAVRWWNSETRRYPAAAAVGLMWALAYPTPGVAGLAWVAPGLLLLSGLGLGGASAFRVGYVAGLVQAMVSLRWLLEIPHAAGAVAGWLAMCAWCAVFPAAWLALSRGVVDARATGDGSGPQAGHGRWRVCVERYAATPWVRRALVPVAVAALWVGFEMLRGRLLGGFPWNFLGASQWRQVPLLQMARVTGVYGVSFLVCWTSVAFMMASVLVGLRPQNRWMWLAEGRVPLFVLLTCLGTGFYRIIQQRRDEVQRPPRQIRLALIQPAIPQTLLWDPSERDRSFATARRLTESALSSGADLLVWPEGDFGLDQQHFREVSERVALGRIPWVFSATDTQEVDGKEVAFNAAFATGPDGRIARTYRKRRLVPFGEYVPLAGWLPFLRHLTPIGEGFGAGTVPRVFALETPGGLALAAPVICFEDIFPHGIRDHAGPGADFLLELTNDGWFGRSGAQWQHLANVVFRAVENDIPIVRCSNNGVTCWIDSDGVVREVLGQGDRVYQEGFLTVGVPVGTGRSGRTWYRQNGDVFGWVCVGYGGLAAMTVWRHRRGRVSGSGTPIAA
jgi:apolipoprotein N-acyltransferase